MPSATANAAADADQRLRRAAEAAPEAAVLVVSAGQVVALEVQGEARAEFKIGTIQLSRGDGVAAGDRLDHAGGHLFAGFDFAGEHHARFGQAGQIVADAGALRRILRRLISNAILFNRRNGAVLTLS